MKRTLKDAAQAVGGRLIGEDHPYGAVATDSRTLNPGSLFVALRGPNFDGTQFVKAAAQRGAIGALVERETGAAVTQVLVNDTLRALQSLAAAWRAQFKLPIVAVAGSNGKTTAKEMTAAILARMGAVMATHGNLNNHIGVPVHVDAFGGLAPQRRGGDGREPRGRCRRADAHRATHRRSHHQCRRGTSGRLR